MTKTWKKVTTFLLGLVMLGGAVGGGAFANSVGGGVELNAAEQTVVFDFSEMGMSNAENLGTRTLQDVTFAYTGGGSAPKYYTSGAALRIYASNAFKLSTSSGLITLVEFDVTSGSFSNITSDTSGVKKGTNSFVIEAGLPSLDFKNSGTAQVRFGSMTVTVVSEDITLDDLYVTGEEAFTTFDVLTTEDFLLDGTKSGGTEVTFEDVTAQIGHDTELRDVEWGVTKPLVTDTLIRFTSLLPNTSGEYDTCDVNITVTEPKVASIAISGDMTKKSYIPGDYWDPSGLVVTGTFDVGGTTDLTNEVEWTYSPGVPTLDIDYVIVTASYNGVNNSATINDIVVENLVADTIDGSDVPQPSGDASYDSWTPKGTTATYVVHSYTKQDYIQLRDETPSGVVSTISGGKIKSITIEWASNTVDGRNLSVYASNSPYSSPADLYSGSYIAQLNKGDNETTYEFVDEYSYVGVRSASGTLYLNSITFVWEPTSSTVTLDSVEVVGAMNKTEYYTNEEWKADGLSVNLHYSDGEFSNITSGYTLTWDPATPTLGTEQVSVTATYNNVTSEPVTFNVTVQEYVAPVYSFRPTADPEGFTGSVGSFTGEGLDWNFYMAGTGAKAQSFDSNKGLHFGSGDYPADTVTLYSDVFAASTGETMINRIVVNASSASGNDGSAKMDVKINNAVVGSVTLTKDATDYSFVLPTPAWGVVEIALTNGGKKAAMYIGGVDIYAKADATITTDVVAAINALTDFRTCDITQGHEAFGTFLTTHASALETLRGMNEVYVHDYENDAYANEVYVDGALKTRIITVAEKLAACEARYQVGEQVNAPSVFGNNDTTLMVVIIVIALASVSSLIGFHYYDKKRRVNK